MMHDLPTPDPSSDAPMPGSSPTKPVRHGKALASAIHRAFPSTPFAPLDFNSIDVRTKAFLNDRRMDGATPPPSSPTMSAALASSPVQPIAKYLGLSPTKPKRAAISHLKFSTPRTVVPEDSQVNLSLTSEADIPLLGLTENLDAASDPDHVAHLLFASRSVSLVLGRCKPSELDNTATGTSSSAGSLTNAPSSTQGLGSKRVLRVNLPNDARHVSRIHAIVEWIPFVPTLVAAARQVAGKPASSSAGTFVVRIVGQNGLIVDGKRRREGQVLRLTPGKSLLDFFGVKCRLEYVPTEAERTADSPGAKTIVAQPVLSPIKRQPIVANAVVHDNLPSSPPPTSSPPAFSSPSKTVNQVHSTVVDDYEEEEERSTSPTPAHRRAIELTAGPLQLDVVRAGDSDHEGAWDHDDDEDEESEDYDFVPPVRSSPLLSAGPKNSRKTDSSEKVCPNSPKAVEILTESQTMMPPPKTITMEVRNAARRSASHSPAPTASAQDLQETARRCVRQLAPTYDLAGLLAGAIVFHRTATISASEAVRSVLATTPGLMKGEAGEHSVAFSPTKKNLPGTSPLRKGLVVDGWPIHADANDKWTSIARKAWREHLEVTLQSSLMFGVIHRAGKDASGNPLEFWYYYDKEQDPDKERAENLGAFVKPMRKALKGQKPIFWKRSGYPSRQEETTLPTVQDHESMDIATESLPSTSIATNRKRKSQTHMVGDSTEAPERKREKLLAKIARSGLWDETQPEEKEEPTWDRKGDQDYGKSRK